MPVLTINTLPVIQAQLYFPRWGCWRGVALVDAEDADDLTGALALDVGDGQLALTGHSGAVGAFQDAVRVEVIGGRGALATSARARHYHQPSVERVVSDLLGDAGETLSSTSDAAPLAVVLPQWTTLVQPVGAALDLVVEAAGEGVGWRLLPGGDLWIGEESWPDAEQVGDLLTDDPQERRALVGVDVPLLLPGTTYRNPDHPAVDGQLISRVMWDLDGDEVRCRLWFEAE
jgi:hypothetical protein